MPPLHSRSLFRLLENAGRRAWRRPGGAQQAGPVPQCPGRGLTSVGPLRAQEAPLATAYVRPRPGSAPVGQAVPHHPTAERSRTVGRAGIRSRTPMARGSCRSRSDSPDLRRQSNVEHPQCRTAPGLSMVGQASRYLPHRSNLYAGTHSPTAEDAVRRGVSELGPQSAPVVRGRGCRWSRCGTAVRSCSGTGWDVPAVRPVGRKARGG